MSPREGVRHAAELELDVLALTDHDSSAGWAEAAHAAEVGGITFIPGVDLPTKLGRAGVHVLASLAALPSPPLAAELAQIIAGRDGRLGSMVDQLQHAGIDITEAE